jgi:hypothetical protein
MRDQPMNPGTPANTRRPNPRNYLHQAPTESPTMQLFQAARKKAAHASNRLPEPRLLAAPDQPRNIAAQKLLRTCGTTSRSQGPPTGADRNRLPSSPVLEAVRRLAHLRHTSLHALRRGRVPTARPALTAQLEDLQSRQVARCVSARLEASTHGS